MIVFNAKYRSYVYATLVVLLLSSFMFSYAVNSISIGLLILFVLVDTKQNLKKKLSLVKSNRIVQLYLGFFLAQIIGLIYTENLAIGYSKISKLIPLLFLPILALSEDINKSMFVGVIEALKFCVILIFVNYLTIHVVVESRPFTSFVTSVVNEKMHMSQFYLAFVVLVPLLFDLHQLEKKNNVIFNGITAIFLFFCLILLQNKTTILITGFILLLKTFFYLKNNHFNTQKATLLLLALVGLFAFFITIVPSIKNKFNVLAKTTDFDIETIITKNKVTHTKNTLEHRFLINDIAVKEIKNSLPLGVGTGDYLDVLYKNYDEIEFKSGIAEKYNNHNQYLAEFLKTGVLGGIIFLVLIFYLLKSASVKDIYYLYTILFFSLACMFESYLERQHGVLIFSFLLPFLLKFDSKH